MEVRHDDRDQHDGQQPPLAQRRARAASAVARSHRGQQIAACRRPAGDDSLPNSRAQDAADPRQRRAVENDEAFRDAVSDLNVIVQRMRRELQFTVEQDSGEVVVKVIDTETDQVVRQIPPEEVVELRRRLSEAAGAIFRDSV
jgi:flagellar protein FlaG